MGVKQQTFKIYNLKFKILNYMQHLIRKQIIELNIEKNLDAFRVQHLVSQHYWKKMLPDIGKAFDQLSEEEIVLHFDKLEIDLGTITHQSIEQNNWSAELTGKVTEQIRERVSRSAGKQAPIREEVALSICKQWFIYMQKGYLPWNTLTINKHWFESVIKALATDFQAITELRKLIEADPFVARRIVFQHSKSFIIRLVGIMNSRKERKLSLIVHDLIKLIYRVLPQTQIKSNSESELENEVWSMILKFSAANAAGHAIEEIIEKTMTYFIRDLTLPSKAEDKFQDLPSILPVIKKLTVLNDETKKQLTTESQTMTEVKDLKENVLMSANTKGVPKSKKEEEDGIFVENAGIILLHPFLNQFLKRQKLVENGGFVNTHEQKKAVFLLHFLATGETEAEEHLLVIPKILCEFPLEEPIEKSIELSESDKNEASDLLTAAIQQWEILKNTSIAGFRESFLQRNGKLITKKEHLYLQIETSSIDLLLDHLPWNLSIIKLPWMKEMLRVEWR